MSRRKEHAPIACAVCGKTFVPRMSTARYCSKSCYKKANNAQLIEAHRRKRGQTNTFGERTCAVCGAKFMGYANHLYCSKRCLDDNANRVRRERRAKKEREAVERTCACCGDAFQTVEKHQRYCSAKCRRKAERAKSGTNANPRPRIGTRKAMAILRKAEAARLKAKMEERRKNRWKRIMAEINAPIGDDEPLRKYIG